MEVTTCQRRSERVRGVTFSSRVPISEILSNQSIPSSDLSSYRHAQTRRRPAHWAGLKHVTLPRLTLRGGPPPSSSPPISSTLLSSTSLMDLSLLFRKRDSIFGIIWNGTPPDVSYYVAYSLSLLLNRSCLFLSYMHTYIRLS